LTAERITPPLMVSTAALPPLRLGTKDHPGITPGDVSRNIGFAMGCSGPRGSAPPDLAKARASP